VEELYAEKVNSQRKVPEFKSTLDELHDLSKSAPEKPEATAAFEKSVQSIDNAIAAVPERKSASEFVLDVMNRMLKTAAEEYKAAIANNKFVELIEYQDSRGFVLYAEDLTKTLPIR